ncbi:hypothetical protein LCGC14_3052850, partial [marine sediment metagenome]
KLNYAVVVRQSSQSQSFTRVVEMDTNLSAKVVRENRTRFVIAPHKGGNIIGSFTNN